MEEQKNVIETLKKANEVIKQQRERLLSTYDHQPSGIAFVTLGEDTEIKYMNKKGMEIFGCTSKAEILSNYGSDAMKLVYDSDVSKVKKYKKRLLNRGDHGDLIVRALKKDGTMIWLSISCEICEVLSGKLMILIVFFDISSVQEDKILNHKVLQMLANKDYSFVGVISVQNGSFKCLARSGNDSVLKNFYNSYEKAVDSFVKNQKNYFVTETECQYIQKMCDLENIKRELSDKKILEFNINMKYSQNGDIHTYHISFVYMEKEMQNILICCTDASKSIREEIVKNELVKYAFLKSDNMSNSEDFIEKVNRQLKPPLGKILEMSNITLQEMNHENDTEKMKKYLNLINSSARYLNILINDILDIKRIENGSIILEYKRILLNELLAAIHHGIRDQIGKLRIEYQYETNNLEDGIVFMGDFKKIYQVILNLVSSRIDNNMDGHIIKLKISQEKKTDDSITLVFSLRDNGTKMSEDAVKQLFDPSGQEKDGFGLAICQKLVHLMGGKIMVNENEWFNEFIIEISFDLCPDLV